MKMVSKVLSVVGIIILCFALLPLNASAAESPREISITYDFPEPRIEENWRIPPVKGDGSETKAYVSVTMEGLFQWSEAGLPVLPFKTARILLPYQTDTQDIIVSYGNKIALLGSYLVEPGQEPVPLSFEGLVEPSLPNSEIYGSSARFPEKVYSRATVQSKRGYRILLLNLYPVEYIPQAGQLSHYESITVKVTLGAGEAEWLPGRGLRPGKEVVRGMVDNPQIISSYPSPISSRQGSLLEAGDYEYVIITNEDLEATPGPDNFQALRDEKISRGITATIVTTEWIYANYSGTRPDGGEDNQTRIRNFITDAYTTWGTTYVLLGGDGDGADVGGESGDDIIPHRGFASVSGEIDYDIPADMYYACLDGTFDDDGDGIYGEPSDGPGGGEVDLLAEVYVGRAPVDSQAEVTNFVRKTLAYQNISKTDENLSKVWMVGEYIGFGGVAEWGGNYKDEIKEGSGIYGYTTVGFEGSIYSSGFEMSTLYDRDYAGNAWPTSAIIEVINGNAHLINHLGHANVGYVMKMANPDVDGLTNNQLCFIGYSQGCYSGSFDNRESLGSYTSYDCIAEHLTTEAHGAVAFIANSRFGWGVWYSTDGPSQHYDREFWDAILGEGILNIGIANQDSKEDNAGRIGIWVERYCYYEINLFGDPELSVKLAEKVAYASHNVDDSAGDGDGYPEPGESIAMPVTLRNTSTDTAFTGVAATLSTTTLPGTTIFSEDFEGAWPGNWEVGDSNADSGEDYWGQSSYWAYTGSQSAYCAEVSDISEQGYDNDMEAFMGRSVDLSTYDSATLSYSYWLNCEGYYDHLDIGYYDGSWHWVESYTGTSDGWVLNSIMVPVTATEVRFQFYSDFSSTYEGAYIDDVVLTGYSRVPDPYISILTNPCEYGDIPAGGEGVAAYGFNIDPTCPSGHVVTFNLDITATNGGPWTSSFNVPIVEHYPISDIVKVTTDPGSDYRPAIAEAADGKVWVVWQSYRSGNSDIWYKTSSDGGATWSTDSQITTDPGGDYYPAIAETADGKIWVVWQSYRSGNPDIWYKTSPDGGATWSTASPVTTDPGGDYYPAIAETADGKVWVVWQSYRSGNSDIWYKTTKDGATWSTASRVTTDPGSDYEPAIAEAADGKVWVVWQSYRSGNSDIWYKTSSDGGGTWSTASRVTTDPGGDYCPAIAETADGKIWVVWESSRSEATGYQPPPAPLGGSDIWYKTSSDGGGSWSTASQFTKFSGSDVSPGADALSSGKLAVAWSSDRAVNYDVWYGIIGSMEDINPPPHLDWVENEPSHPDTEQVVTIRARASDESGLDAVQLVWWLDGTPQDNLPMYDDGNHNDYGAGDGVYGVQVGPFPTAGTIVEYQIQMTDIDSNLIVAPQYRCPFEVSEPFVKTADILLVADQAGSFITYYTDTLDSLGNAHDVWDNELRGNIDGETLNQYLDGIVIWATPSSGYISYSETRDNLASYLDNGGSLFISGQDIGCYIGSTAFYRDYLHTQYVQDNIGLYALSGISGDPVSDGLYVYISGGDGANNQWWPSEIDPILPAVTIFTYDPGATMPLVEPCIPEEEKVPEPGEAMPEASSTERGAGSKVIVSSGSGAIRVDTGSYKVVYFAFGFEAINSAADRLTVMEGVLDWLGVPLVEEGWSVPLAITSAIGGVDVTFGANSLATDGFDEAYDYPAPPPPMEGVEAYFYYPSNPELQQKLATSIVAPADSIIWPLKVKYIAEGGAGEVTITWQPSDVGSVPGKYVTLELQDDSGNKLADMRTETSYTFAAAPDVLCSFQVKVELFHWDLKAGWNMISLPVDPGTTDPAEIFSDVGSYYLYTWDATSKKYVLPTELTPGKAYWILVFGDATQIITGTAIDGYSLSGNTGWYMIGSLSVEAQVQVGSGDVFSQFYTWDATDKKYVLSSSLEPGNGYWLLAYTDFSITVIPTP